MPSVTGCIVAKLAESIVSVVTHSRTFAMKEDVEEAARDDGKSTLASTRARSTHPLYTIQYERKNG